MKLRYLNLIVDRLNEQYYSEDRRFAYNFTSNCRFIANYLSKAIRKNKVENYYGIRMLCITLTPDSDKLITGTLTRPKCVDALCHSQNQFVRYEKRDKWAFSPFKKRNKSES